MWKEVKGYENLYIVNDIGEIKSVARKGTKGTVLKQDINKNGYKTVTLSKDGKRKTLLVHRVVFYSFYPHTSNDLQINHKNENTLDNNLSNLEAITQLENLNYGTRNKRISKSNTNRTDCSKKIMCKIYLTDEIVGEFDSTKEVERVLGVNHSHVSKCCKGKYKQCNGYKFEYM